MVKWSPLSLGYIVHLHTERHVWVSVSDVQGEGRLPSQGDRGTVGGNIHFFDFIKQSYKYQKFNNDYVMR